MFGALVSVAFAAIPVLVGCQAKRPSNTPATTDQSSDVMSAATADPRAVCESLCSRHHACPSATMELEERVVDASGSSTAASEATDSRRRAVSHEAASTSAANAADVTFADDERHDVGALLEDLCGTCDLVTGDPQREAAWSSAASCGGLDACEALRACVGEALHDALVEIEPTPELGDDALPLASEAEPRDGDDTRDGGARRRSSTRPGPRRGARRPGQGTGPGSSEGGIDGAADEDACVPYCDRALACGVDEPNASEERIATLRAAADAPWFECLRTCRLERSAGRGARLDACLAAPTCDGFAPCLADE